MSAQSHRTTPVTNIQHVAMNPYHHHRAQYMVLGDFDACQSFQLLAVVPRQTAMPVSDICIYHLQHFAMFLPMGLHWPAQLESPQSWHARPPYHAHDSCPCLLVYTMYHVLRPRQPALNSAMARTAHCACQQPFVFHHATPRAKYRAGGPQLNYCATPQAVHQTAGRIGI